MSEDLTDDELPLDDWHNYAYMLLAVTCDHCDLEPDLVWVWDGLPDGDPGARAFALRAVAYLKREGWRMLDGAPYCPRCIEKLFPEISD